MNIRRIFAVLLSIVIAASGNFALMSAYAADSESSAATSTEGSNDSSLGVKDSDLQDSKGSTESSKNIDTKASGKSNLKEAPPVSDESPEAENEILSEETSDSNPSPGFLPEAPSITKVISSEGRVRLYWEKVNNADGYIIQRQDSNKGAFIEIGRQGNGQGVCYSDTKADPSITYRYRIISYNKSGKSMPSPEVQGKSRLDTPCIRTLRQGSLAWDAVPYATSYKVYAKSSASARWKCIGTTSKTSYKIQYHKSWYYTVKAFRGKVYSKYDATFTGKYREYQNTKVLIDGDSMASKSYSWVNRSSRMLGYQYTNRATAGTLMAWNSDADKSLVHRAKSLGFKGYNVIILSATNDYHYDVPLGKPDSTDDHTFCGAYNYTLAKIKEQAPYAKVILCLPSECRNGEDNARCATTKNQNGDTLTDFKEAIRALAKRYQFEVYDPSASGVITADNISTTTSDNLHPTVSSSTRISDHFTAFLRQKVLTKNAPVKVSNVKVQTSGKRKIKLTWSRTKKAAGYEICIKSGKRYKRLAYTKGTSYSYRKKLQKDKSYSFKVRAYTWEDGVRLYGSYYYAVTTGLTGKKHAVVKKISISPAAVTLKHGSSRQLKVKMKKSKGKKLYGSTKYRWYSSNPSVVSVNSKGVVKGLQMGSATVYCIAHNGVRASAKVNVAYNSKMNAKNIPVLTFHRIVPDDVNEKYYKDNEWVDSEKTFQKELQYIKNNGYRTISLQEYKDWYSGKIELPENSVFLTMDDGYYETYHIAYPIVKKLGLRMTTFIVTGRTGETTATYNHSNAIHYMGMDAVEKIRSEYPKFEIEGHSNNMHYMIPDKNNINRAAVFSRSYEECLEDIDKQQAKLNASVMAYPYGYESADMFMAIMKSPMDMGFGFGHYTYSTRKDFRYNIVRIKISGKTQWKDFLKWVRRY